MIESIEFQNFKVLRHATLPLGPFTLIVGPNGSGKSTALQAFVLAANLAGTPFSRVVTAGQESAVSRVEVGLNWSSPYRGLKMRFIWLPNGHDRQNDGASAQWLQQLPILIQKLHQIRIYSFEAGTIASPVTIQPKIELQPNGSGLAAVLDRLRDESPERFESLNAELARWLPEFDRILFETVGGGTKEFRLRTRYGQHAISAADLSQGTLFAVAILTLAYLPVLPPPLMCFEDPDRGLHPRLLRNIQDALYRLSYPKDFGESRDPVQVIATTHSPYFLDLYKDHPDEVVIAQKTKEGASFEKLSDRRDIAAILGDTHLGDAWYSGILGGVPSEE